MKNTTRFLRSAFPAALMLVLLGAFFVPRIAAEEDKKIPRRVYSAPVSAEALNRLPPEQASLVRNLPYFLFSAITSIQYIVLVDRPEEAYSSVTADILEAGGRVTLTWTLRDKEAVRKTESFAYDPAATSLDEISKRIRAIAEAFAPLLTEVAPEVSVERKMQEERQNRIIKQASFEDSLAKPFQLTLWGGGFLQYLTAEPSTLNFVSETHPPYPTHLVLDLGWYPSPNFGLISSLYFDMNDKMYFGSNDVPSDDDKEILSFSKTENLFTLAGFGFGYRTLGRIAGEFNILLYLGLVNVTAKDDVYYLYRKGRDSDIDQVLVLSEGDKASFFFTFLSIQPALVLNLTERFSLKARVSINLDPRLIVNNEFSAYPFNRYSNMLFMYLGEIGAAIRF
jgi:hypothetical protein